MRERKGRKKSELSGREGTVKCTSLSVRGKIKKNWMKRIRERGGGGGEGGGERGGEGWGGHFFQRYK